MKSLRELEEGDNMLIVKVAPKGISEQMVQIIDWFDFKHNNGFSKILYFEVDGRRKSVTASDDKAYKVVDVDSLEDRLEYGNIIYCIDSFDYKDVAREVVKNLREEFSDYLEIFQETIEELDKLEI